MLHHKGLQEQKAEDWVQLPWEGRGRDDGGHADVEQAGQNYHGHEVSDNLDEQVLEDEGLTVRVSFLEVFFLMVEDVF